jgi:GTP-binding protein EngB required for normal cell division
MAIYHCDSCNADRDDDVCEKCGRETRLVDASAPAPAPTAVVIAPRPAPPRPEPPPVTPSPQAAPLPRDVANIRGLDEFHALLDRGLESIIVCGSSQAGKSEIAAGFTRANSVYRGKAQFLTLRTTVQAGYSLGGTVAGEVWYQLIDDKRVFLDPSGEFFNLLSAEYRQRFQLPEITEDDFRFVQRAVSRLAGIVLVVDLTRAVDDRDFTPWRRQENELNFVLPALRWLRWDKEARPDAIGVTTNIAQRANALPMLDKPVLVLFSKADQLTRYVNQSPLDFAKRRLPILHGALMTHAKRFRYDFCHTMTRTAAGDQEVDNPCGVLLPVEWLLHDPFRWLPFRLPTRLLGGGK